MLVVYKDGRLEHCGFATCRTYLHSGDIVVVNDTKVIPARLHGRRLPRAGSEGEGAKIELMLHKRLAPDRFLAFARPAKKLVSGDRLKLSETLSASVSYAADGGEVRFNSAAAEPSWMQPLRARRNAAAAIHRGKTQAGCARRERLSNRVCGTARGR